MHIYKTHIFPHQFVKIPLSKLNNYLKFSNIIDKKLLVEESCISFKSWALFNYDNIYLFIYLFIYN